MYNRNSRNYMPSSASYRNSGALAFGAPAPTAAYPMYQQPQYGYSQRPQWTATGGGNYNRQQYNSGAQGYSQSNKRRNPDNQEDYGSDQQQDYRPSRKRRKPEQLQMPVQVKGGINDKITEGIWKYFEQNRQNDNCYRAKVDLRDALYVIFKDVFPYCGLYMVGSSMSGFATKTSDMDLCLMITEQQIESNKEAIEILVAIQRALRKCGFLRKSTLIRARVPILKFEDRESGVEVDLNINNSVGIRNTHLLRYYAAMDWRVRPLVLFVKKWARFHDINDASKRTISSYSLCLMVLHYLQYGCNPPVLDSIQKCYPDLFYYGDDIRNLKMNVKIEFKSKNSQSLGDLFFGFLQYYTKDFNFDTDVISVRQGCKIPIHLVQSWTPVTEKSMWKCLKCEEPFDKTNTARSCYDERTFARVHRVFARSYALLSRTRNLDSILSAPF